MKRIFYFAGHRLTVFHWSQKKFLGGCSFEPDTEGLDKFRKYLKTSENIPTKLLVDVIEEDFRRETVPHVYRKDREAVISRLLDRYYRSSNRYTYAEIIGREKTGRKDNEVLIGGITNPNLIQPWIAVAEECNIPLSGIWTLPLISKQLLPVINAKKGPVLLISQQVNSNLRQTFFRDGKMLTSRQSVINQDSEDISNIGKYARPEVERTRDYLRVQKLVEPNEPIQVHILGSATQLTSLRKEFKTTDGDEVFIHHIKDIQNKLGIEGLNGKLSDELFSWLCMSHWNPICHYGKPENYERYYYTIGSKILYGLSVMVALVALLITESNLSSVVEHSRAVELMTVQAQEYKKVYKNKFESFEPVFSHARSMNAAVDLAERIYINSKVSPLDFMIEISDVLSQSGLGTVNVDEIDWTTRQLRQSPNKDVAKQEATDITRDDPIQHVGMLKGRISVPDNNYRASVAQINKVITALMSHERIEEVEAVEMPVEVRPEKDFADESGLDTNKKAKSTAGAFTLKIIMKGPDRV